MAFVRKHPRFVAGELAAVAVYTVTAAVLGVSQLALVVGAFVLLVVLVLAATVVIGPAERAANRQRSERQRAVGV